MRGTSSDRWFWSAFFVALAAALFPLAVSPYLPFTDLHGAAGLLGAIDRSGESAARIHEYFSFHIKPLPNVMYWAVGWLLSRVMPITAASNVYVAVFCVAALPLALLYALRSFGRSRLLVFLVFPVIYHRGLWFGFMGSVPAVPLMFLAFGLANQCFTRARPSWRDPALAATLFALTTAHAFLFLCTVGLLLIWAVLAGRPSRTPPERAPLWRRGAVFLPAFAYLGPWLAEAARRAGDGGGSEGGFVAHLLKQRPPLLHYVKELREWLLDAYVGHLDDVVAAVFALTLLLLILFGIRGEGSEGSEGNEGNEAGEGGATDAGRLVGSGGAAGAPGGRVAPRWRFDPWRLRLPLVVLALWFGFFALPMAIKKPFYWWAVNVRLLVPGVLALLFFVPVRARGLPRWALAPVLFAGLLWHGALAWDFRTWFHDVEMAGFDEALDHIPQGQKVHALYPTFARESHYGHFPMAHIVDYYVVRRGGLAVPLMDGHPHDLWVVPKPLPPRANWGQAVNFQWGKHAAAWDYFLVKKPAPGNGAPPVYFAGGFPGAALMVYEQGLWSVWRRATDPAPAGAGPGGAPPAHTGPAPPAHTGSVPAAHTGSVPAAHTGPVPAAHTGSVPAAHTGSVPAAHTGSVPAAHTGPAPPAQTGLVPAAPPPAPSPTVAQPAHR